MKKVYLSLVAAMISAASFGQAFFTQTSYRGAFAQSGPGANWMSGWTNFDPRNAVYPGNVGTDVLAGKTRVDVGGNPFTANNADGMFHITTNTTWTSNNVYYLTGPVAVDNNVTLTIQAGTFVRGTSPVSGIAYLVISRGAKLNAVGTPTNPIVFTSDQPAGLRDAGDWGGLMICGNARVNLNNSGQSWVGERNFEATATLNATRYGNASNPNNTESSGNIQYVRVEFAGDAAVANQELNGLMLAGVGSGTTVNYVQVSYAEDDSFEWFGGTVNSKYLVAFAGTDDDFDVDEGFSGRVQFAFAARHPNFYDNGNPTGNNSHLFEMDNNTTGGGVATSNPNQMSPGPVTSCVFSNVTCVGPLRNGEAATAVSGRWSAGVAARSNPATGIFNSVIIGSQDAIFNTNTAAITGVSTGPSNYQKLACDSLVLRNNYLGMDNANSTALVAAGGFAGTTTNCGTPLANTTDVTNFLTNTNNNNIIEKANLTAAYLGITAPYYTGSNSGNTGLGFANAGTISFASIDPTLQAGSPFLAGADFTHPRLANFLVVSDITVSSTQNLTGAYNNVTITGTGVATLTGGLNIAGTLTVQNGGVLNMGTRSVTGNGNVVIAAGATVRTALADGFAGTVLGALRNTGSKSLSSGANYEFNGAVAQTTGAFFTGANNLTINNTSGVTLSAASVVGGILRLQAGAFNAGNNLLTINSTATSQGVIDNFSSGFTGSLSATSIRFRRWTNVNFRHFASPLSGGNTLGNAAVPAGFTCGNIREFDEPSNTWVSVLNPCASQPMNTMESFLGFAYQQRVIEFTGVPLNGNQTVNLVRSAPSPGPFIALGWNAVANPYPSSITWSLMAAVPGNTAASGLSAYIWNSATQNYGIVTSAGVASGGASNTIAPGQGILVRKSGTAGSATLTFANSVRTSGSTQTFIRKEVSNTEIRFSLKGNTSSDEVVIYNGEGATDAEKLFSPSDEAVELYITGGEEPLTFKTLQVTDKVIPVAVKIPANGTYTISADMIKGLDGKGVYLEDKATNKIMAMNEGAAYKFSASAGASQRFAVHFQEAGSNAVATEPNLVYTAGNELNVKLLDATQTARVNVSDLSGRIVFTGSTQAGVLKSVLNIPAGVYTVSVNTKGASKTQKVIFSGN